MVIEHDRPGVNYGLTLLTLLLLVGAGFLVFDRTRPEPDWEQLAEEAALQDKAIFIAEHDPLPGLTLIAEYEEPVYELIVSPGGRWLAERRDGGTVGVWRTSEVAAGRSARVIDLRDHEPSVEFYGIAFPDDRHILAADHGPHAAVVELESQRVVSIDLERSAAPNVFFSADGRALRGIRLRHLREFDLASGEERRQVRIIDDDNARLEHAVASPDRTRIALGTYTVVGNSIVWPKMIRILESDGRESLRYSLSEDERRHLSDGGFGFLDDRTFIVCTSTGVAAMPHPSDPAGRVIHGIRGPVHIEIWRLGGESQWIHFKRIDIEGVIVNGRITIDRERELLYLPMDDVLLGVSLKDGEIVFSGTVPMEGSLRGILSLAVLPQQDQLAITTRDGQLLLLDLPPLVGETSRGETRPPTAPGSAG